MPIQIYRKFHLQKLNISDKNSDIFHISAQNIDCRNPLEPPQRGGSYKYPQSMFLSRNKKKNVYPCQPQFYYIRASKLYRYDFVMQNHPKAVVVVFVVDSIVENVLRPLPRIACSNILLYYTNVPKTRGIVCCSSVHPMQHFRSFRSCVCSF